MTKVEMMNQIKELENKMLLGKWEIQMVEVVTGGDQTFPETELKAKHVWVPTYNKDELQAQIDELRNQMTDPAKEAEKERKAHERYIREKARRYRKELEEIMNRAEYLKKWLAENA